MSKTSTQNQEGNMTTIPNLPENVVTKDGETVPSTQAVALNYQRIGYAKIVLLAQLGLHDDSGLTTIQMESARITARTTSDPKAQSEANLRLAKLRLAETAIKINAVLREKGPTAFCFTTATSAKATQIAAIFGTPALSQPVKGMAKDAKVPELFVPLATAYQQWQETAEKDAQRRTEAEAAKAAKAEKAKLEAAKADAERNRQAIATLSIADAILADTVETAPEVVQRIDAEAGAKIAEDLAKQQEREKRLQDAREWSRALVRGKLRARGYYNVRAKRGYVAHEESHVLSQGSLASLHGKPADTEIWSQVWGTVMNGRLGDTRKRDDKRERWMCVTAPTVTLVTKDDKPFKDRESKEDLFDRGFVPIEWREAETLKATVVEMVKAGEVKFEDRDGAAIEMVDKDGRLVMDAFLSIFHLKALSKAAKWAAENMAANKARHEADQNGDQPGKKVFEAGPDDFEPKLPAPKADTERKNADSEPKAKKATSKSRKPTDDGNFATGAANPGTKDVPGHHVAAEIVTRHEDEGTPRVSMLDAFKRTIAKAERK